MLYFEDLAAGRAWSPGSVTVTGDEIRAFAERYDPQPFHVDAAAGERHFGGLVASGWHTAALCMRPFAEHVLDDVAIVAAAGVDDLRWHEPVRPGDTLTVQVEVVGTEPWSEDRGLVRFRVTGADGDGELVHSRTDRVLVERRDPADADTAPGTDYDGPDAEDADGVPGADRGRDDGSSGRAGADDGEANGD